MAYTPYAPVNRTKTRTGKDAPHSGGIAPMTVQFALVTASETKYWQWSPPAGMNYEIIAAYAQASTVSSDPSLTIGSSAAGTQIVDAVNLTTALGDLTIRSSTITPGDTLDIRIASDANDKAVNASVTIVGYCSVPPTAAHFRGDDGKHF